MKQEVSAAVPSVPSPSPQGWRLAQVGLRRGATQVFDRLELQLDEPRIGLIGRNGAGKTSLLRMLAGLEPPQHGQVSWQEAILKYTGENRGVLACPAVDPNHPGYFESYRFNSQLEREGEQYQPMSELKAPVRTVVVFDAKTGTGAIKMKGKWEDVTKSRHGGRANFLFADWHVETFTGRLVDAWGDNGELIWDPRTRR